MTKIRDDIFVYVHPKGMNCIVYAFTDGKYLDLVDSGIAKLGVNRGVWNQMKKDGLDPRYVRNIFHCHIHTDHVHADTFFQKNNLIYGGSENSKSSPESIPIRYPDQDFHRYDPTYGVLRQNFTELSDHFPTFPYNKYRGTMWFIRHIFEPFMQYNIPKSLIPYHDGDKITLGTRQAKVIMTGGHTEGHSFFHINDSDNILVYSDAGVINEFTSDWKAVLKAIIVSQKIDADTVFGGHDTFSDGLEKARQDLAGGRKRMNDVIKPIVDQLKLGEKINATEAARKRVNKLYKIKVVDFWAHMTIYSFCKFLEQLNLGQLSVDPNGIMWFTVTNVTSDSAQADLIQQFNAIEQKEKDSLIQGIAKILKIQ
jgi:glyoxylase-like metal-dependent hydrolase (beta-lactamase superfamily II)